MQKLLGLFCLATAVCFGDPARAQAPPRVDADVPALTTDGVYGRFAGDLEFALGAGAWYQSDTWLAHAKLSAHYFSMAGVSLAYADRFSRRDNALERFFEIGVDFRPAFVPRWATDREVGPGFLDLTLDSISLGMAAYWAEPGGSYFGAERGLSLSAGLKLPLLGAAQGLWLDARSVAHLPDPKGGRRKSNFGASLALSWSFFAHSPWSPKDEAQRHALSSPR